MKKVWLVQLVLFGVLVLTSCCLAFGQAAATGSVSGTVKDPDGALIAGATVTLSNGGGVVKTVKANAGGAFELKPVAPGRYVVSVAAKGFAASQISDVLVFADKATNEDVSLEVSAQQDVQVNADALGVSVNPDDNASATVIKGKDLDALSDDPDELQNELTALAGPAAGPSGAQIYIDGFTGGQLPPKSSIREIRINRNPFSAQFDKLGYGRIEILTKPGTDKFHGSVMMNGNEKELNTLNPFVTNEPSYYSTFLMGNAGGAMGKSASWFTSVFRRDNQSNTILNAVVDNGTAAGRVYSAAVPNPQSRLDVSPRFDFQLGKNNTLTVRYSFNREKETQSGVSGFSLQSQAYNVLNYENTIQVGDTQVLSSKWVNETRFQFTSARDSQTPVDTTPTVNVQSAFVAGGNNSGLVQDNQSRYEFQDYVTAALGTHAVNFGTRLRLTHDVNTSRAGFNGGFIYTSLANYDAKTPSEYDVTVGNPTATVNLFDAGVFYQDDWTVKPNLTLSYGLRYEAQNGISDHADWAPRFALAWAPAQHDGKKASTVFRAGYGWFYDRFAAANLLTATRENGVNTQSYVVKNPGFTTAPATITGGSTVAPTIYSVAPDVKASVNMQAAVGVDHSFGKVATVSATYINSRGLHQYNSDATNAFVPGTYNAATGTGVRPNGVNENLYQFQSGGVYNQNQLMLNYTVRAKKVSLFGFYVLNFAKSDTSGATYFGTDPTRLSADYGRASFDVRNRFLLGGNWQAPWGISVSPFLSANAGSPFNITLGQDLNGDNQYNDRPSYATAASTNVAHTAYGDFDLNPAANATRIGYDIGTGPAQFAMNLRVSKSFGIGPRVEGGVGGSGGFGGGPGGPGGPRGGGAPGGGLGPGGLSGSGGPPRLDAVVPRRYSLTLSAMGKNVFNDVNLAAPNGVLSSPTFGKSTAIAGGFFGSAASNRSVDFQVSFNF